MRRDTLYPFALGFFSAGYQVISLRRIFTLFAGSEVALGVALFTWMVLYGAGGLLLGKFADRVKHKEKVFVLVFAGALCLALGLTYTSYRFRELTGYLQGELISPGISLPAAALLSIPCIIFGFLFSLAPLVSSDRDRIARAYSLEALGGAGGSLFLLITHLGGFGALNSLVFLSAISMMLIFISFVSFLIFLPLILFFAMFDLDYFVLSRSPVYGNIILRETTPYTEIYITREKGEINLFEDELPAGVIGEKNTREFLVALAGFYAPEGTVLIAGTDLTTACMFSTDLHRDVEVVWKDKSTLELQRRFLRHCDFTKIKVVQEDPYRFVLHGPGKKYSAILILTGIPVNISSSLLFSSEFFRAVQKILKRDGLIVVPAGEVTSAPSTAQIKFQSILRNTIKSAGFEEVLLYPVGTYIHAGFVEKKEKKVTPSSLDSYLKEKGLDYPYASSENIGYLLKAERIAFYTEMLQRASVGPVHVTKPEIFLYGSGFISEIAHPGSWKVFDMWMRTKYLWISIFLLFLFSVPAILFYISRSSEGYEVAVFFTGVTSMSFVIYTFTFFQIYHGSIYLNLSILNAAYFLAIFAGALFKVEKYIKLKRAILIFSVISAFSQFLFYLLMNVVKIPEVFFYSASFLSAFFASCVFRLSSLGSALQSGKWAGLLDFADHTGAGLGAGFTSLVLLPLTGLFSGVFMSFTALFFLPYALIFNAISKKLK